MDKDNAIKQLMELHGIPPYHKSEKVNSPNIVASLQGAFGKPLADIEQETGFVRIRDFYENQMRRVGKEVSALAKQVCR